MATHSTGRFVWHELATPDVKKAVAFYSELFAWKASEMDMGPGGKYTMLKSGETNVGGMTTNVAPPGVTNVPPHWRTYCTVQDVDAAARKATELGGKILMPPMDIPTVGRFAVVADPQGAVLMPFKDSNEPPELEGPPAVGTFCWDELLTTDAAAAAKFYTSIYGWTIAEQDMGPQGTYRVLKRGERMSGGIMKSPMPGIPPVWTAYVAVASVDASSKRVESLGGKIVVPPSDIPNMGRFSVFVDTTGATLCMFQGK